MKPQRHGGTEALRRREISKGKDILRQSLIDLAYNSVSLCLCVYF